MRKLISSSITKNLQKSIKIARENNLGIEISRFNCAYESDEKFKKCLNDLKIWLKDFDYPLSVHGFFFDVAVVSPDTLIKKVSIKRYNQSLEIAREIGAKTVVFHTNYRANLKHKAHQAKFLSSYTQFWQEYSQNFENAGVTAVIENVNEPNSNLIHSILKNVNSKYLKASIDVGHVNVHSEKNVCDWIKDYNNDLLHMHLHNNFGEDDSHNSISEGTLDFTQIIKTLKQNKLEPIFVFEIFDKKNALKSVKKFEQLWETVKV